MTKEELAAEELEKAKQAELDKANPENWDPIDAKEHQKVVRESMKRKQEAAQLREELEQIRAEREAATMADLEAKQEHAKVAELYKQKYQEVVNEQSKDREAMVSSHKKAAVIQAVGGFIKASYADMAINLENIAMIDGVIDQSTLDAEVERIRRDESALLKKGAGANLPHGAPEQDAQNRDQNDFSNMNEQQKMDWRRNLIRNRSK